MAYRQKSIEELLAERKRLKQEGKLADRREQRAQQSVQESSERAERLFAAEHLREYQKISVLRALSNFRSNRCTLDASDMGLGKTRMAGAFIGTIGSPRLNRVLWLTSKNLVKPTRKELAKLGLTVVPFDLKNMDYVLESFDELRPNQQIIFITHYQSLGNMSAKAREEEKLNNYIAPSGKSWDALFIDEVTAFKGGANVSGPTGIWKLAKSLIASHPEMYRYFLSGTPVENHPREVWAYLHLFDQTRFPRLSDFERAFCNMDIRGELKLSNDKLFELLRSFIIRNTYQSAGIELPPISEDFIDCELEPNSDVARTMKRLKSEFGMWLEDQPDSLDVTMVLEQLLRQRQLLCTGSTFNFRKAEYNSSGEKVGTFDGTLNFEGPFPKMDVLEEKLFDLVNNGEQAVVFCCFNDPLKEIQRRLSIVCSIAVIDGSTKNVPDLVEQFQAGKLMVLCINKLSGAHGLNLQKCDQWPGGASHMFHLDRWWNPAREKQAIGRLQRMNTNAPVFNHYLHVAGEVDDVMLELNEQKQAYADAVDSGITVDKSWLKSKLGL